MQESGEMYLETIYVLSREKPIVRSIDVADRMSFSKPSVSRAMGILKSGGHIEIDKLGAITLTESGRKIATGIYERHTILTEVLKNLGVSEKTASEDACKIEHYISEETFKAVKKHFKQNSPKKTAKK